MKKPRFYANCPGCGVTLYARSEPETRRLLRAHARTCARLRKLAAEAQAKRKARKRNAKIAAAVVALIAAGTAGVVLLP
jgi:hypothetical protein